MALPSDYAGQACSLARSLEIVGERWTLLLVRDAFYGVRRFGDFAVHLRIPRAVLTDRLKTLVDEGVLARVPGEGRRMEYELTDKGISLWPVVHTLTSWGDEHYAPEGPRRVFRHALDGGLLDPAGRCGHCGVTVDPRDVEITPGPGLTPAGPTDDPVTAALTGPHRLLDRLEVRVPEHGEHGDGEHRFTRSGDSAERPAR